MASSLNFKTDIGRIGAALPRTPLLRHMLFALLVLFMLPLTVNAQDDDRPTALVLTAKGPAFSEVVAGIKGDLDEDVRFVTYEVPKGAKVSDIEDQINKAKPKLIVLVENHSIKLYGKYQKAHPKAKFPPSIAVAALFVDRVIANLKNATGIRYEIPAVTSIVNLRSVLSQPVKRVGVVHREWMKSLIEENAKYCRAEGIELVPVELPNKDSKMDKKLKEGLETLVKDKVDALWILNDNALLNGRMIGKAWLPVVGKANLPVIVGVRPLLNSKWNFGSFAIVPDHYALGVQAASIIGDIMDNDWELDEHDIEQPVSVKTVVNVTVLDKKNVKYRKDKLNSVDEVVH